MPSIDIDFDVFKALTIRRENERMTENDVIRDLLKMPPAATALQATLGEVAHRLGETIAKRPDVWVCKAVAFPVGTAFRAKYQGATVTAEVRSDGLHMNGEVAGSPSQAARMVTGTNVNGWTFWECRFPGESRWRPLRALRPS